MLTIIENLIQQQYFWGFATSLVTLATVIAQRRPPRHRDDDRQ